jgi:hypothetical protein
MKKKIKLSLMLYMGVLLKLKTRVVLFLTEVTCQLEVMFQPKVCSHTNVCAHGRRPLSQTLNPKP